MTSSRVATIFSAQWQRSQVSFDGTRWPDCERRRYRPRVGVGQRLPELARTVHLGVDPAAGAGGDVALGTGHTGVVRILMADVLGSHHVAGCTAELRRVHVHHRTVGELGPDQQVDPDGDHQKHDQPLQRRLAVDDVRLQAPANAAAGRAAIPQAASASPAIRMKGRMR